MPMPIARLLGSLVAVCLLLSAVPAGAQQVAAPPAKTDTVSADELQRLVDSLQNEQDRARLVQQLQALIAAERSGQPSTAPAQPAPSNFFDTLSRQLDAISGEILATAAAIVDAPRLVGWIESQASNAEARARWLEVLWHLGAVFALAVLAEFLVRAVLARPRAALANRSSASGPVRLVLTVLRVVMELVPLAAFAAVAYFVLPLLQPRIGTRLVAEVIIRASVLARALLAVARALLISASPLVGLLGAEEETRNYLYIWTRRFVGWAVYGYAVAEAAWWLGVPGGIYTTLLKSAGLVLAVLAIIFVLQNRQPLAGFIGGKPAAPDQASRSGWRLLRHRLADTWHVLAVVYIAGIYAVYALQIQGGFAFLLRATLLSIVLVLGAGILVRIVSSLAQRGFAIHPDLQTRFPTLETRANRYLPVLSAVASTVIYLFAGLALLQAWGADILGWFASGVGRAIAGSAVSIGVVIALAIVIWELFSSAIERYLTTLGEEGASFQRSARARTLLPLLRTAMMVLIVAIVALVVLSQIGVNIAPLLAGAGIVGIAIGFGAQALVKDVITGLFILIEDTLAVGDVVDVGNGHSGVVEGISIRCLKLRDGAGTVHTVPFSDVTAVKNLTRDYAFYVVDIGVAYGEDTDRVVAELKRVADGLKADPAFGPFILAPLEVIGLDRFDPSGAIVQVRLKTLPSRQWSVGREFNRRFKKAFDAAGIEMPVPLRKVILSEGAAIAKETASAPADALNLRRPA
ncbi:MAG TPA: mechanosensitive ion channel domain-containing protein [Stellaceae bacterium]|nr:mechanosensitive ion channel domain-containing protein [Stellaceae bacterium]